MNGRFLIRACVVAALFAPAPVPWMARAEAIAREPILALAGFGQLCSGGQGTEDGEQKTDDRKEALHWRLSCLAPMSRR